MKNINRRSMLLGSTAAAIGAGFKPALAQTAGAKDPSLLTTTLTPFGGARRQCRWHNPGLDRRLHQRAGRLRLRAAAAGPVCR